MRLFGKVNGIIDRFDRAGWLTDGFDKNLRQEEVPDHYLKRSSALSETHSRPGSSAAPAYPRGPSVESETLSRPVGSAATTEYVRPEGTAEGFYSRPTDPAAVARPRSRFVPLALETFTLTQLASFTLSQLGNMALDEVVL